MELHLFEKVGYTVITERPLYRFRVPDGWVYEFDTGPVFVPDPAPTPTLDNVTAYDAGMLNDHGGGDINWWHDYIRSLLGEADDYYRDALRGEADQ